MSSGILRRQSFFECARRLVRPALGGVVAGVLAASAVVVPPVEAASVVTRATVPAASTIRHLRLVRSDPTGDSTVAGSPAAVRLWFSQRPELAVTTVRLTNAGGVAVPIGKASLGAGQGAGAPVVFPIGAPLVAGRYTAAWRTMAPDGHVIRGEFTFSVRASGAPAGA